MYWRLKRLRSNFMNQKKILFGFLIILFYGCATYKPQYRDPDRKAIYPSEKTIEKSFYLVGDAGKSPMGGMSDGLKTFQNYLKAVNQEGDYTVFLGDNIYPAGMPEKGDAERKYAENAIDAQLNSLSNFKGETIFIPGNHDWYSDGLNGLLREAEYIREVTEKDMVKPAGGCPVESISVSENIQLIVIDSQWYLEDWNTDPAFNEFCEIKTREKFFIEIANELEKNQGKTILFAMHHPMFTNGSHGGYFGLPKHLYPLQKKIPMPGLASLVAQIRTQGGVSVQDRYNELYNRLMNRLATIAKSSNRLVFASGHEHSMHHIEQDGLIQIQTGNGAKASYGTIGQFGDFSYGGQGFAVMDVFTDGSSWVRYYGVGENFTPELLFEKEMIPAREKFDTTTLPNIRSVSDEIAVPIYTQDSISEALFFQTTWGKKYKEVYNTPVNAKIGKLDSLFGGVRVVRETSNSNHKALILEDKNGNRYTMRTLRKNALQYQKKISNTVDEQNPKDIQNLDDDDAEIDIVTLSNNFFTASHPYSEMAIPKMANALDIFSTNPRLFYVPKQESLGNFNSNFGDELYFISIEPNEDSEGQRTFEYPDDIETTDDILIKLRRRGDITLDEESYIKSRLFDMLIGDVDRESDHWRWAEYYNRDSLNVFVPIPRNRSGAFASFEGTLLGVATSIFGSNNQRHVYDADLKDLKYFNREGIILDRALIQRSGRTEWEGYAKEIQETITDELIDEAFSTIPQEVQDESLKEIITTLKARRDNLGDIAKRYYEYLSTQQTIEGSDFNDFFEITRLPNGETNVKVYPNYKTANAKPVIDRTFSKEFTKEIWIYGLDGQDGFDIKGEADDLIYIRVIGGQGIDTYRLFNGRNTKIYDHDSRESIVEVQNSGSFRQTDVYTLNTYDYRKQINRTHSLRAQFGYNPDDGITTGAQYIYQINSFQRNPFSQRHTGNANYYFDTQSFDVSYAAEFANIQKDRNLSLGAYVTSPNYTVNYFGYGNETTNNESEVGIGFNRVQLQTISATVGLLRNSNFGSFFKVQTRFDAMGLNTGIVAEANPGTIAQVDETILFATLEGIYSYRSYDDASNPSRGMMFDLNIGATDNLEDVDRVFGFLKTRLGFYNSLVSNQKLVLKTNIQAGFNFDNKFEFYQAMRMGGETGLRGYRAERFSGKSTLVGSADLRYSFDEFRIELVPLQVGIYIGADVGKLWVPSQTSDKWHNDYGAGLWINGSSGLNSTFSAFRSVEGTRFTFGLGVAF